MAVLVGSAVGIDVTPDRFAASAVRDALDPVVTEIEGLYLTGQDTLLCGVTLAQVDSHALPKAHLCNLSSPFSWLVLSLPSVWKDFGCLVALC